MGVMKLRSFKESFKEQICYQHLVGLAVNIIVAEDMYTHQYIIRAFDRYC